MVFLVAMMSISLFVVAMLVCANFCSINSFSLPSKIVSRQHSSIERRRTSLGARVARKEDEQEKAQETVVIPFDGLVGREQGSLFDKPLDVFDPIKDTDSLPGADGSDEKIAAIQARIQERVAVLKKAGQWDDGGDVFGKDPLATQPIWQTMAMQVKICRPFDSFIVWFINTDFDNDFLSGLFNQS